MITQAASTIKMENCQIGIYRSWNTSLLIVVTEESSSTKIKTIISMVKSKRMNSGVLSTFFLILLVYFLAESILKGKFLSMITLPTNIPTKK